jgi:hypothetical protein
MKVLIRRFVFKDVSAADKCLSGLAKKGLYVVESKHKELFYVDVYKSDCKIISSRNKNHN